jgi:hypothetical protein
MVTYFSMIVERSGGISGAGQRTAVDEIALLSCCFACALPLFPFAPFAIGILFRYTSGTDIVSENAGRPLSGGV